MSESDFIYVAVITVFVVFIALELLLILIYNIKAILKHLLRTPFKYPYFEKDFDVTGRRNVKIENLLDEYLIEFGLDEIREHKRFLTQWKLDNKKKAESARLKKLRIRQYNEALDDQNTYHFNIVREQTRYTQRNYVKTAYKVLQIQSTHKCDLPYIMYRYNRLKEIDFSCTLSEFESKKQRNLMKPQLREFIKERDNYTCQICGKYMPDEVGLHIDHIVPIAKGGKTIASNLQVLCSKCNGAKRDK
jgi:5-methylcytosine-specific restriction endonuclease McrA